MNDDTISRQAAIDAAKDWYEGLICGSFRGLEKRLKSLPSAQPQRERGKWRTFENSCTIQCNQCLSKMTSLCDIKLPNFCPSCGAEMREGGSDAVD